MKLEKTVLSAQVLVIGSGFAGCRAAIEARGKGCDVLLVCEGEFLRSGSSFGPALLTHGRGCAVSLGDCGPEDTPESLFQDSLSVAEGMADEALLRVLVEETPPLVRELEDKGFILTRKSRQTLDSEQPDFSRHVRGAGLYHYKDNAVKMASWIKESEVRVLDRFFSYRILTDGDGVRGVLGIGPKGDLCVVETRAVVIAAGGPSDVFAYSLATQDQGGVGSAMAVEAGARLVNIEFFQAIPGLCHPYKVAFPELYLALEPEIRNGEGKEFLTNYLPPGKSVSYLLRERSRHAPFHSKGDGKIFDFALKKEILAGRSAPHGGMLFDLRKAEPRDLTPSFFPFWKKWMIESNLDPFAQVLEIAVFIHACNGGIMIDREAGTDVPGLYACGESAGGPHGANRIGGMQVAAALVFGKIAGESAAKRALKAVVPGRIGPEKERSRLLDSLPSGGGSVKPDEMAAALKNILWSRTAFDKTEDSLSTCRAETADLKAAMNEAAIENGRDLVRFLSLRRRLEFAEVLIEVERERRESRGPHFRPDFPEPSAAYAHRYAVSRREDRILVEKA
jgi:succinate dehydrogenase/fumarate reductase flavoprotein subunit